MITEAKKGDRLVAYSDARPAHRLFIEVTRVAKDGTWADIRCCTWAVMWTKRQLLPFSYAEKRDWTWQEVREQEDDHMLMLREEGLLK